MLNKLCGHRSNARLRFSTPRLRRERLTITSFTFANSAAIVQDQLASFFVKSKSD
jgi:hypothetical protein